MNDTQKVKRLRDAIRRLLRHKGQMGGGCSLSDDIRIAEKALADTARDSAIRAVCGILERAED